MIWPVVEEDIAAACAALVRGVADGGQQRKVAALIGALGMLDDTPYVQGDARQSDFNAGRQFVALAFMRAAGVALAPLPPMRLREEEDG